MKMNDNEHSQLDLEFLRNVPANSCRRGISSRQRRRSRAAMWFNHMRKLVDEAGDWPAAPVSNDSIHSGPI
jgi:hypothetical protein